jgi:hypothetical protein
LRSVNVGDAAADWSFGTGDLILAECDRSITDWSVPDRVLILVVRGAIIRKESRSPSPIDLGIGEFPDPVAKPSSARSSRRIAERTVNDKGTRTVRSHANVPRNGHHRD